MIPIWILLLSTKETFEEFAFNCNGTNISIKGTRNDLGWKLSVAVHIFGVTSYGYNNYQTNLQGTWQSVILPILQKAVNEHKAFSGGRAALIDQMRVLWKSQ